MSVLKELRHQGLACLYISHKLDEVFELCDRMVILRDGCYISEYRKENGYNSTPVIEDMIGRHLDVMYPSLDNRKIGGELLHLMVKSSVAQNKTNRDTIQLDFL